MGVRRAARLYMFNFRIKYKYIIYFKKKSKQLCCREIQDVDWEINNIYKSA